MSEIAKIALVTGAGSGIGRATALAPQEAGYAVVLAGRRPGPLEETARLGQHPDRLMQLSPPMSATPSPCAPCSRTSGRRSAASTCSSNNAGISAPEVPLEEVAYEQWSAVVGVNLTGAFLCAQEAIRLMKAQCPRGGRIINNGSLSAHMPRPHAAPYTATKHALTGLTTGSPRASRSMAARMTSPVGRSTSAMPPQPWRSGWPTACCKQTA